MLRLATATFTLVSLLALGCSSDKTEPSTQDQGQGVTQIQPVEMAGAGDTAAIQLKPSGVRFQEMAVGDGREIADGMFVEFDYNCWMAGGSGLDKLSGVGTSVGRPGMAYKAKVGVHPLPGLSDGIVGMRFGGSRRVFVPGKLGFPEGHPWFGQNMIYEVIKIKEIPETEVTRFQDSTAARLEWMRRVQDSLHRIQADSLAAMGLDSLGQPIGPIKGTD
ncbi:MAG: FKBP-type peptidyl-prolyl cis-trans isomerase [Candidatus Zixiibacteriota bacterium]